MIRKLRSSKTALGQVLEEVKNAMLALIYLAGQIAITDQRLVLNFGHDLSRKLALIFHVFHTSLDGVLSYRKMGHNFETLDVLDYARLWKCNFLSYMPHS